MSWTLSLTTSRRRLDTLAVVAAVLRMSVVAMVVAAVLLMSVVAMAAVVAVAVTLVAVVVVAVSVVAVVGAAATVAVVVAVVLVGVGAAALAARQQFWAEALRWSESRQCSEVPASPSQLLQGLEFHSSG